MLSFLGWGNKEQPVAKYAAQDDDYEIISRKEFSGDRVMPQNRVKAENVDPAELLAGFTPLQWSVSRSRGYRQTAVVDILTAINDGDSRELGSWLVPGSSPRLFSITFATPSYALAPQAITACPAANMFNAAFISACSV